MATVANLAVSFTARYSAFEKGMKRMSKQVRSFGRDISRSTSIIHSQGAALLALATGGGIGLLLRNQFQAIDQTAKFADVIGLTTQQLTGYQLAAQYTGTEINQLNTGLTRFEKNVSDATFGLQTPVRELAKLGLTARQLQLMSTDQQLKIVAERFSKLGSNVDKAGVLLNLFGRSGITLGKLLDLGSKGIERYQQQAQKLGLSFSRGMAARVEAADDAMLRFRSVIIGSGRALAFALSPWIKYASDKLVKMATSGEGVSARMEKAFGNIVHWITKMTEWVNAGRATWYAFAAAVNKAGEALAKTAKFLIISQYRQQLWRFNHTPLRIKQLFGEEAPRKPDTSYLDDLIKGYSSGASKAWEKANKSFVSFATGENQKAAEKIYRSFQKDLKAARKEASRISVPSSVPGSLPIRLAEFRQFDPNRIALGRRNLQIGKQEVYAQQLDTTNNLLRQLVNRSVPAVAV